MVCQAAGQTKFWALKHESGIAERATIIVKSPSMLSTSTRLPVHFGTDLLKCRVVSKFKEAMEVFGNSMVAVPTNVNYLSSIIGQDGPNTVHKCNWKCENEHVCGNIYRCRLTGLTHIWDKNFHQRILYDNHSSFCRVSRQVFPLTAAEELAVRGVRRKLYAENSPSDSCAFKHRRDSKFNPSPFEKPFSAVSPTCSQVGGGMDMS